MKTMSKISIGLLAVMLAAVGLQAAEKVAPASKEKAAPMPGEWKITCVGKQGNMGQKAEAMNQSFMLTFLAKPVKGKGIEGKPFGFAILNSHYSETKPGGNISFTTTYKMMSNVPISWRGKLSEDGTQITDGKYSFMLGSGTFTAEKVVAAAKKAE
jgi:hypothetical protein